MIANLKIKVTPLESVKAVADNLAAGNDVSADFSKFKLKVELDAEMSDIQTLVAFIRDQGKSSTTGK